MKKESRDPVASAGHLCRVAYLEFALEYKVNQSKNGTFSSHFKLAQRLIFLTGIESLPGEL